MYRSFTLAMSFFAITCVVAAPAPEDTGPAYIDISAHTNVKLTDNFHTDASKGNNLANLPTGKQTFAGVKFKVGTGLIQLGSASAQGKPAKVEGIKVDRWVGKLQIMHATGFTAGDGQVIAKYVVHYDDKSTADIEIAYGRDVVDWWVLTGRKDPTHGKVAWEGENESVKGPDSKIKLFLTTWENPNPKKKIVSIDYIATAPEGQAAPFCIAITAEEK